MILSGLGYGNMGASNRAKVLSFANQLMQQRNITPEEFANTRAEWEGRKAGQRALGTQEARMGSAAYEAGNAIDLARGSIEKVPRTNFLPFNHMLQAYQNQTLSPDQAELFTRTQAVINGYSAVMARGANVTTDASRHRAEDLLNTAANPETYNRVLDTLQQEIDRAKRSPKQMREFYRKQYGAAAACQYSTRRSRLSQSQPHCGHHFAIRCEIWTRRS